MRDPARIRPTLDALEAAWRKHPDWRLGQLIVNTCPAAHRAVAPEIFYPEDDEWLAAFEASP